METDTFITDNFTELLNRYKKVKEELNEAKQNLYESSRQLKLNEALLTEYQSDIEVLQNKEQLHNEKFEAKVASLEETISSLRSNHSESISYLETELEKKEKENEDLKNQIELLKKANAAEVSIDVSANLNEIIHLTNENELLQEKIQAIEKSFEDLRSQDSNLRETLEEYKEELGQVKESLKLKKEELLEKESLIDKLTDELICANRELINYKDKPLEADSKGNSLFAEVDDRRVHLQDTINQMKSSYIQLKQEHGHHVKLISHLRKEKAEIRESWKKDLEEIQEEKFWVNNTLKSHIEVLEKLLEDQKKQLEAETYNAASDLPWDQFYQQIINEKSNDIEKWKKKYLSTSVNEHSLSMNLAQANKKLRILKLELQLAEDLKEANAHNETANGEVLCHNCNGNKADQKESRRFEIMENRKPCVMEDRIPLKSCLKQTEPSPDSDLTIVFNRKEEKKEELYNLFQNDDIPYTITHRKKIHPTSDINEDTKENIDTNISPNTTEDLLSFQSRKNVDLNVSTAKVKSVGFSKDTVDPIGNPARKRGTRVFFVSKNKSGVDNIKIPE